MNAAGFSYDTVANGTVNFRGEESIPGHLNATSIVTSSTSKDGSRLLQAATIGVGSADPHKAVNTTEAAIRALWLSLFVWIQDFPEYKSHDNNLGLWAASYGGHYAPALYDFTVAQNKRQNFKMHITSIGLLNACVDALVQLPEYPEMAFNNTYGLQLIDKRTYDSAKRAWDAIGGCRDQIVACRNASTSLLDASHPYSSGSLGTNSNINGLCHDANAFCGKHIASLVSSSGRDFFDLGHRSYFLSEPTLHTHLGYLRQADVQAALGVAVNFTDQSTSIAHAFARTGDNLLGSYTEILAKALDDGVRVSMVYGDRDYACNWLGGEALSLAIASTSSRYVASAKKGGFSGAGYQSMIIPGGDRNGRAYVRQHGNLSFTRVLDSGHTVNTAWPAVGLAVFHRSVEGVDIGTGLVSLNSQAATKEAPYSTQGPSSTWHIKNELPSNAYDEEGMCYSLALSFCSDHQLNAYLKGNARVKDYWVLDYGDGTCSPNPVEPCVGGKGKEQIQTLLRGEGSEYLGNAVNDVMRNVGWIIGTCAVVALVVWLYFPVGE